jgi:hypothetical protein
VGLLLWGFESPPSHSLDSKEESTEHGIAVEGAPIGLVDNQVDNEVDNVRQDAAAALLEQAAALARIGAGAEVESILRAARGLLMPGAEVVPLKIARAGRRP